MSPRFAHTAHRKDGNHDLIREAFERAGCQVLSLTTLGGGAPDLLVHHHGRFLLIEVKQPKGKLREKQDAFREQWPVYVARTVEDVRILMKVLV